MSGLKIWVIGEVVGLLPGECLMPAPITRTLTAGDFVRNPERFDFSVYLKPGQPKKPKQKAQWKRELTRRKS